MSSTVLIIGAGPNIGKATATAFLAAGYKIAIASRSTGNHNPAYTHFAFDASKPQTVPELFSQVRAKVGVPNVVIYNAHSAHVTKAGSPFDISPADFETDVTVNTTTPFESARAAVAGFEELLSAGKLGAGSGGATFIFTGNLLDRSASAGFTSFAVGKSGASTLIQNLALAEYADKPFKFYYGDQRLATGKPMLTGLSGTAHAELYLDLARDDRQRQWRQAFVEGKGYTDFPVEELWVRDT